MNAFTKASSFIKRLFCQCTHGWVFRDLEKHAFAALLCYLITTLPILILLSFSPVLITPSTNYDDNASVATQLSRWDSHWYEEILVSGYSYEPNSESSVAFFPFYPLLAQLPYRLAGFDAKVSLLIVSHIAWISALMIYSAYFALAHGGGSKQHKWKPLILLAVLPMSFYFRTAHTESLLLLLLLLVFWGVKKGWNVYLVAIIAGAASATRLVGIAAAIPLLLSEGKRAIDSVWFVPKLFLLGLIASSGFMIFMLYQHFAFGNAFAFVQTQTHWNRKDIPANPTDLLIKYTTFEPVTSVYNPHDVCYWCNFEPKNVPFLNCFFLNPIYFLGTFALVVFGRFRNRLDNQETLVALLLLLIPYGLQGYRFCMGSMARFLSVVFPAAIVAGYYASKMPNWMYYITIIISFGVMLLYLALYGLQYPFY